jgi:hypothetical protein
LVAGLYQTSGSAKLDVKPMWCRVLARCEHHTVLLDFNPYNARTINTCDQVTLS